MITQPKTEDMSSHDGQQPKANRRQMFPLLATTKQSWLLLWFLVGFLALPGMRYLLPFLWSHERLTEALQQLGPWATIIFIGLHIAATALGVPGVILTMVGGICFGVIWGSLWSLIGATLGAVAAFGMARYLMHDWCDRHFGRHRLLTSLNQMVDDRPFWLVLTVRFAPISPFNVINFLFGLTEMPALPYIWGTLIGIIPGVVIYTWFGMAGYEALHGEGLASLLLAGAMLGGLSALPLLIRRQPRSA